ncbi:MAG: type I-B CRISPR-associated protein Cas5b [Ignavibacteria bacterium]
MKLLRLKIYQPQAHYRIPFTYQRRHTYPIPPYSTVIGFLINLLGLKDQSSSLYSNGIKNLKISIAGSFETKTIESIWFRNLSKESHKKRFGSFFNRSLSGHIEHFGGQSPMKIDILNDVYLIIYLFHNDQNFLELIKENILNPVQRLEVLHLGRAEDWIVFDGLPKLIDIDELKYGRFDGNYKLYFWIPEKIFQFDSRFINYNDFTGLIYNLPVFSEIENYENTFNKNGRRKFSYIKTKLNNGEITKTNILVDLDSDLPKPIPIFFGDLQ